MKNANSDFLASIVPTSSSTPATHEEVHGATASPVSPPSTSSREARSLVSEIIADSKRKSVEAKVTMTVHLPEALAKKLHSTAIKANLSRNELVKLILEKALEA